MVKQKKMPDPDKPLTHAELKSMKWLHGLDGLAELMGEEFVAPLRLRGRPKKDDKKVSLHLRVDKEIADRFRASGRGWQTRINALLLAAMEQGQV